MRQKRFWRIAMVCVGMVLAAWACANPLSGAAPEEPVEEAAEPEAGVEVEEVVEEQPTATTMPTPTPEPQADLQQVYRNEGAGYSMNLPEEWVIQDFFFITYAASSQAALDQANGADDEEFVSPVIMAMIVPPEEEDFEANSIEELNDQMMEEFEPDPGLTFSEPVKLTVGGLDAMSVDISGTDPDTGQEIYGRMISVMGPQHAGVFIAASPLADWEEFEPTFTAIIESVEFFEPDPEAMMEDFEQDLTEGLDEADVTVQAETTTVDGELRQWAVSATASSEYNDPDWAAFQAIGAPDTYPECGDIPTAWASAFADGIDTLTLNYATPVIPTRMEIYQTLNPGAISKIELIDTTGTSHIIFVGEPKLMDVCPYIMVLSITGINEPVDQVIIHVDQSTTGSWNEIDAVELIGKQQ